MRRAGTAGKKVVLGAAAIGTRSLPLMGAPSCLLCCPPWTSGWRTPAHVLGLRAAEVQGIGGVHVRCLSADPREIHVPVRDHR